MIHLNKAIINIRTTQVDINTKQDEVIELITEGKFYKKVMLIILFMMRAKFLECKERLLH